MYTDYFNVFSLLEQEIYDTKVQLRLPHHLYSVTTLTSKMHAADI